MLLSKNIYVIVVFCCVVVASIIVIVYNTHMLMKSVEEFTQYDNAFCDIPVGKLCRSCIKPKTGNVNHLSKYHNFKDMSGISPFEFLGCTDKAHTEKILSKLETICYISYAEFNITSTYNVYAKIVDDLNKLKSKICIELLLDPVYTIVFQDVANCLNDAEDNTNKLVTLYVVYPKYNVNTSKNDAPDVQKVLKYIDNLIIADSKQCKGTVYKLNKNHKMFYDLLAKKENTLL